MSASEFGLINNYFKAMPGHRRDVLLGIGDDAAITSIPQGHKLVTTVDTLVQDIHFDDKVTPADLACKALAVNLSDLAAMGAEPAWITLSLTIPEVDHDWLKEFSESLQQQCRFYDVQLIGGDTCRGRISITIQAMGVVPDNLAIKRSTAEAGDLIYVTGTLGDAGAGLSLNQRRKSSFTETEQFLLQRLHRPTPRLEAGVLLRNFATSAIDISDGLLQDVQHILDASDVGAVLKMPELPISDALAAVFPDKQAQSFALTAGDDYELCFTIKPESRDKLERCFATASTPITLIGHVTANKGLQVQNNEKVVEFDNKGFDHFAHSLKA
ncbi:MAG: thiamine-phosphate kinase [Gammaproteobacteria bacterium]|jgi:thiamine-monophosphate kinase